MEKIKVQKLFHLKNRPPKSQSHRVRSSSTSSPIKKCKREGRALSVNRNVIKGGEGRKKQQQ